MTLNLNINKCYKALTIILLFYPLYYAEAFGAIPALLISSYVAFDVLLLYKVFVLDHGKVKFHPIFKYLIFFYFYALFSGIIIAPDRSYFLYKIVLGINYAFLSVAIYWICLREKEYLFFARLLFGIAVLYMLTALSRQITIFGRLVISEHANANSLGVMCIICIVISVYISIIVRRFAFITIFLAIPFSLYMAILSGSRKSFLGSIIFLLLFLLYTYRTILKRHISYTIIFLLGIVFLLLYFRDSISSFWMNSLMLDRFERGSTIDEGRVSLYEDAFQVFLDNPLFGVGYTCFQFVGNTLFSHSAYMEVLAGTGIIGFFLWMSFLIKFGISSLKAIRRNSGDIKNNWVMAYLLTQMILDFFSVSLYLPQYMALLGFAMAVLEDSSNLKDATKGIP